MGRLLVSSHRSPCELLCARFETEVECVPAEVLEASVAPFVGDVCGPCEYGFDEGAASFFEGAFHS